MIYGNAQRNSAGVPRSGNADFIPLSCRNVEMQSFCVAQGWEDMDSPARASSYIAKWTQGEAPVTPCIIVFVPSAEVFVKCGFQCGTFVLERRRTKKIVSSKKGMLGWGLVTLRHCRNRRRWTQYSSVDLGHGFVIR